MKKIKLEHIALFVLAVVIIFIVIGYKSEVDIVQNESIDVDVPVEMTREEFNDIFRQTSEIESFEFDYSDSDMEEKYHYQMLGSDIKVTLPIAEYNGEEKFDTIYLSRLYKVAYTYCSRNTCKEKDTTAEPIDFEKYVLEKPTWIFTRIAKSFFVGYEMLGNHNTTVIDFEEDFGNKGRMWLQNYYKVPLKVEYSDYEGHEREIVYENYFWNNLRLVHVAIPGNVTLVGYEGGSANPSIFMRKLSDLDFEIS